MWAWLIFQYSPDGTDIGVEFGMKRRGVLILKRKNVKKSVGITSPAREDKGDREGIPHTHTIP